MSKELLEINRRAIYAKINKVYKKILGDTTYFLANDIIYSVSEAIARDKRLISDYDDDQVVILMHKSKYCRFLTIKGIQRYVHEGKIYSYVNVCQYFNVAPHNKQDLELLSKFNKCIFKGELVKSELVKNELVKSELVKGELANTQYITSMLLKFIFGKRKQISALGIYCTKAEIMSINITDQSKSIRERYLWVITMMK